MEERERKEALLAAVRDLVPDPVEPAPSARARRGPPAAAVVTLAIGWALLAWLWLARPAWVFGPDGPPPLTEMQRDAAMRVSLWLERGRIEEYVGQHGRLPGNLEDAGPVEEEVSWIRQDGGFLLRMTLDGDTMVLSDRMDADSFLGNAIDILRR